jgi:hypothetical protein
MRSGSHVNQLLGRREVVERVRGCERYFKLDSSTELSGEIEGFVLLIIDAFSRFWDIFMSFLVNIDTKLEHCRLLFSFLFRWRVSKAIAGPSGASGTLG